MRYTHSIIQTMIIALTLVSVMLILVIGVQAKGTGLSIIPNSTDFGKFERRGPEKILHNATIVLVVIFIILALVAYFS